MLSGFCQRSAFLRHRRSRYLKRRRRRLRRLKYACPIYHASRHDPFWCIAESQPGGLFVFAVQHDSAQCAPRPLRCNGLRHPFGAVPEMTRSRAGSAWLSSGETAYTVVYHPSTGSSRLGTMTVTTLVNAASTNWKSVKLKSVSTCRSTRSAPSFCAICPACSPIAISLSASRSDV
jgi:hypothetical protein